jgi:para-nitrobenzyl esterase
MRPDAELSALTKARIDQAYGAYPDLQAKATAAYTAPQSYAPYGPLLLQYGVDHSMRCEAVTIAAWHSAVAPTYQYEFTAGAAAHPPVHSAELDFVFGYLRDQASDPVLVKLSDQIETYWTNFAKTGDPNGAGLPKWPRFDARTKPYIEFGNAGPEAKADLRGPTCAIFAERLSRDIDARKD